MADMHTGHRQRLRKSFMESPESLSDVQFLELLLTYSIPRQDVNPLAHRLLDRFGSLSRIMGTPPAELTAVEGVSERTAVMLSAMQQLTRRLLAEQSRAPKLLKTTGDAAARLIPEFFGEQDEAVWLLCLDARCAVLDCRMLFRGSVNTSGVSVRRVAETALSQKASSVVLAHNHPAGSLRPSQADLETTRQIRAALKTVGIALADHVIVAGSDYYSMAENGCLPQD